MSTTSVIATVAVPKHSPKACARHSLRLYQRHSLKTQAAGLCFPGPQDPATARGGFCLKGKSRLAHTCRNPKDFGQMRIEDNIQRPKPKVLACVSCLAMRSSRSKPKVFWPKIPKKLKILKNIKIKGVPIDQNAGFWLGIP